MRGKRIRTIDVIGRKFGLLMPYKRAASGARGEATFWCECECGNKATVLWANLRNGRTRSCGCLKKEYRPEAQYRTWEDKWRK